VVTLIFAFFQPREDLGANMFYLLLIGEIWESELKV